jgi:hypothetical protein
MAESIRDVIQFSRDMGIKDCNCIWLTEEMLREVCADSGLEYNPDEGGRQVAGSFIFQIWPGLATAIALQPGFYPPDERAGDDEQTTISFKRTS